MIIVAVVVYNRFQNIKRWISSWKLSNTKGAKLVIVHNYYGDDKEKDIYESYCNEHDINYVPRNSPGFDIGAFQDVCRERLAGFPDFDYLLWCTDDCLPISKNFIQPFVNALKKPGIGISCMKISESVDPHVRTTGFCLTKETASKLQFPADPIISKQDCYLFEHRGKAMTMTNQIRAMGLSCVQVAHSKDSPLYDTGYWKRLNRDEELNKTFPFHDKVTFVCTITTGGYPQIISSLLTQTSPHWELLLIHNGPSNGLKNELPNDERIKFIEVKDTGYWGHPNRSRFLQEVKTEYVVITNNDNYMVPVYVEYMLKGFANADIVGVYCSKMVHSYVAWDVMECRLERGFVDCAGVMLRTKEAQEVGWKDTTSHSADWTFFNDLIKKYSVKRFAKVKGALLVHN